MPYRVLVIVGILGKEIYRTLYIVIHILRGMLQNCLVGVYVRLTLALIRLVSTLETVDGERDPAA